MTGLDARHHHLVEIACIVTEGDNALTVVGTPVETVINQPTPVLDDMSDWCKTQFEKVPTFSSEF